MGLSDEISLAMRSAPETRQDPSLAITSAALPGDTQSHTEVAAHLMNQKAIGSAVENVTKRSGGKGIFGATLSWLGGGVKGAMDVVGSGIMTVGHVANMPLEQVKQQYRYLRDVQARHGFGAMLLDAIPMAAGAAAGFAVAGPLGGFATAGLMAGGAALTGKAQEEGLFPGISHKDSWERTASADYRDPHGGQEISFGRDVARSLNFLTKHVGVHIEQHKGFDLYDAVSGIGDGLTSVILDPLSGIGGARKAMIAGDVATGPLARMATKWGGVSLGSDNFIRLAAENAPTERALHHLASLDAGTIAARYKKLRPFARELGEADTFEKVGQVFKDAYDAGKMTERTLPRRTISNASFGDLYHSAKGSLSDLRFTGLQQVDEAGQTVLRAGEDVGRVKGFAQGAVRAVGKKVHATTTYVPASFDDVAKEMQKKVLHFNDPGSAGTIYDLAKWGHSEGMAREVAKAWAIGDINDKQLIYRNVVTNNIANLMELTEAGWAQTADGAEVLGRIGDEIDGIFGGIDGGRMTPWGFDKEGRSISRTLDNGKTVSLPVHEGQVMSVPMPNYMVWRKDMIGLRNSRTSEFLAGADDFLFTHFTQNVFRRWALASGGFAIRAAAQDLVPYLMKAPKMLAEGAVTKTLAKRGWSVDPEEEQHIIASIVGGLGRRLDINEDDIADMAEYMKVNNGHVITPGVQAGYNGGVEILGTEQYVRDQLRVLNGQVPKVHSMTSEVESWSPGRKGHYQQWHKQAKDMAEQSPAIRAAAVEYKTAIGEGVSEAEATHRAVLKAKEVLDTTPKEILEQHPRHFLRPADRPLPAPKPLTDAFGNPIVGPPVPHLEQALPRQGTGQLEWIEGKAGKPGHWESTGEVEVGQWTTQKPLVTPSGGTPPQLARSGTKYDFGEGATDAFGRPIDVPSTTTVQEGMWVGEEAAIPSRLDVAPADLPDAPEPFVVDPHLDWAGVLVENMKGTVYGQDQHLHDEVLSALAEGRAPDLAYLEAVEEASQPAKIIGAHEKPAAPDRLNGVIFRKLNSFINWAAREPIFQGEYLTAMRELRPKIGTVLTRDEAIQQATKKSVLRMLPHIDNAAERTLMSEHMRNWIPFYAAQQQAYARYGRLLAEDPAAFRRLQLAFTSMADFGGIYDDEGGQQHMIMPGTGWFSAGAAKAASAIGIPVLGSIPSAFSGNLKSLTSVSPFLEENEFVKVGPLVSMAARAMNTLMPETRELTDPIVGEIGARQPVWEMLVPNATMRNVLKASVIGNKTQNNNVLSAIQFMEFKQNVEMDKWVKAGKDPNDPDAPRYVPGPGATDMERAQFIDRVKNHARVIGLAKAVLGSVSPVAPAAQIGDVGLKDELYALIKEKGISVAIQEFLEKNPDATPYTVFTTDAGTPSPIESTHPTQEWVRSNMSFITDRRYSAAASYFVPQTDDPFNQDVYNEQMAMGLRRTKSPDQLIRDIESARGNNWYHKVYKPAKDAAMAKARTPRERREIQTQFAQVGGTDVNGKPIESMETMKMQNPIWYANFSSGGKDAQRALALSQMEAAINEGVVPDSPMTDKIKELLGNFKLHQTAMVPGRTDAFASRMRKQEAANWQGYLKNLIEEDPSLTMVVNNVFRSA